MASLVGVHSPHSRKKHTSVSILFCFPPRPHETVSALLRAARGPASGVGFARLFRCWISPVRSWYLGMCASEIRGVGRRG